MFAGTAGFGLPTLNQLREAGHEVALVVTQPDRAAGRGLNRQGKTVKVKGDALLARAIQHEIDHLDGILFTDRLTSLETLRKVEPEEQEKEAELVGA